MAIRGHRARRDRAASSDGVSSELEAINSVVTVKNGKKGKTKAAAKSKK